MRVQQLRIPACRTMHNMTQQHRLASRPKTILSRPTRAVCCIGQPRTVARHASFTFPAAQIVRALSATVRNFVPKKGDGLHVPVMCFDVARRRERKLKFCGSSRENSIQ